MKKEFLRKIPKIDEVLSDERLFVFFEEAGRELVTNSARETVEKLRRNILDSIDGEENFKSKDEIINEIIRKIEEKSKNNLTRMINATGVTLHTNLGRAKLSEKACESVFNIAKNYSNLEYDIKKGARGSRHDHVEELITQITGAEASMVVNNNAAATMICLASLAKGKEVIVSRGELVEIGGSFRIPDVMSESGAILKEVGATNKTKVADYEKAINEETAALLKVHTSNYKIFGFTAEVSLEALVKVGKEKGLPVIYDMGSGLLINLKEYGIEEPTVSEALQTGIDLILFSGDKLLGGPQVGILAGRKKYIELMKKHPLARVLRVDKMALAALEATFRAYMDKERALREIPVLSMLTAKPETLKARADEFSCKLIKDLDSNWKIDVSVEITQGQVGGGSAPTVMLDGYGVTLCGENLSLDKLERELRNFKIPVIIRIYHDKICIDMRTITLEEEEIIIEALVSSIKKIREKCYA